MKCFNSLNLVSDSSMQSLPFSDFLFFTLFPFIQPANILMTKDGVLKIADFGLARTISHVGLKKQYTNRVVTLWYRPPELLLGERSYAGAIDMWGAGCIFAEFWTRRPILQVQHKTHFVEVSWSRFRKCQLRSFHGYIAFYLVLIRDENFPRKCGIPRFFPSQRSFLRSMQIR